LDPGFELYVAAGNLFTTFMDGADPLNEELISAALDD
jgi:hypothetical protein